MEPEQTSKTAWDDDNFYYAKLLDFFRFPANCAIYVCMNFLFLGFSSSSLASVSCNCGTFSQIWRSTTPPPQSPPTWGGIEPQISALIARTWVLPARGPIGSTKFITVFSAEEGIDNPGSSPKLWWGGATSSLTASVARWLASSQYVVTVSSIS